MQIVEVDRFDAEVGAAACQLVRDESGREAVTPGDDLVRAHDAGVDVLAAHVFLVLLTRRGGRAVERDVPALGAHHELVARRSLHSDGARERLPEGALGALAAIVDRGVEKVDPGRDRVVRGVGVADVVRLVALAEVAAEADG